MERRPVLLDTDPGSDIDDALAIAYLLCKPECELLGITTVTGEVAKRAAIAEVLCRAAGRSDIPIVAGCSDPLGQGPGQPLCPQYGMIASLPHRLDFATGEAVEFLSKTIRSRPGEITLLSIGPFTNVAELLRADPEIPRLLKGFISMGGAFFGHDQSEWNCVCDPEATHVVTQSERGRHTWIGLDVTTRCTLRSEVARTRFKGPLLELVLLMAEKWFEHCETITFHDPLAAACLFHPKLCDYRAGEVRSERSTGKTWLDSGSGSDSVATTVDDRAFFREFFGVIRDAAH